MRCGRYQVNIVFGDRGVRKHIRKVFDYNVHQLYPDNLSFPELKHSGLTYTSTNMAKDLGLTCTSSNTAKDTVIHDPSS